MQAMPRNARIDVEEVCHVVVNIGPSTAPCIATKERTSLVTIVSVSSRTIFSALTSRPHFPARNSHPGFLRGAFCPPLSIVRSGYRRLPSIQSPRVSHCMFSGRRCKAVHFIAEPVEILSNHQVERDQELLFAIGHAFADR